MLLLNYKMHWDRNEPLKALAYLDRAGATIDAADAKLRAPFLPFVCELAQVEGFERRNPEKARHWLELAQDKTRLDWFLARAAVAYAEQEFEHAVASLKEAGKLAADLPHAGAYDLDREDVAAYQALVEDALAAETQATLALAA